MKGEVWRSSKVWDSQHPLPTSWTASPVRRRWWADDGHAGLRRYRLPGCAAPGPHRPSPAYPGHRDAGLLRPPRGRRDAGPRRARSVGRQRPGRGAVPRPAPRAALLGPWRSPRRPRGQRQGAIPDPALPARPAGRPDPAAAVGGERGARRSRRAAGWSLGVGGPAADQPLDPLLPVRIALVLVLHAPTAEGGGDRARPGPLRPHDRPIPAPPVAGGRPGRPRLPPPDRGLLCCGGLRRSRGATAPAHPPSRHVGRGSGPGARAPDAAIRPFPVGAA